MIHPTIRPPQATPNKLESALMSREPKNTFITKARKIENTKRDDLFYLLFRAFAFS